MAEDTFRLPNSSYDELVKIIRAYGSANNEATLDDVAHRAAIDRTIVSRNNAFLTSVGIIGGGKAKSITERGRKLSTALQHDLTEEIANCWREVVATSDFLQKMVSAVSIRQGMDDSALQSHIAYSAGEGKNARVMAGAGAVVQLLKTAGLLKEQDGKLIALPLEQQITLPSAAETPQPVGQPAAVPLEVARIVASPSSAVGVSIQIQIQCAANEIDGLAPKLRALLKALAKEEEPEAEGQ